MRQPCLHKGFRERLERILQRRRALPANISKLHFERNLAKTIIITRGSFHIFLCYITSVILF